MGSPLIRYIMKHKFEEKVSCDTLFDYQVGYWCSRGTNNRLG